MVLVTRSLLARLSCSTLAGLLLGISYYADWSFGRGFVLWLAAFVLTGAAVTWNQVRRRWLVALWMWLSCFVYVESIAVRKLELERRRNPYCCILEGIETIPAFLSFPLPLVGMSLQPLFRTLLRIGDYE